MGLELALRPLSRGVPGFDQGQSKTYQILKVSLYEFLSLLAFHKKLLQHVTNVIKRFLYVIYYYLLQTFIYIIHYISLYIIHI